MSVEARCESYLFIFFIYIFKNMKKSKIIVTSTNENIMLKIILMNSLCNILFKLVYFKQTGIFFINDIFQEINL